MAVETKKRIGSASIIPDPTLMKKLGSLSGTNYSKILELVDNSVDAKIKGKKLHIDVRVVKKGTKQYIEVQDDGCGMTEEIARSYFQIAKSEKEGEQKIGRFGMGSKVAIIGLGDTCQVETKAYRHPHKINISFDIREFRDWEVDYQVEEETSEWHGTRIRIDHLTVRIGDLQRFSQRLKEHLSKTYKHFIKDGDVIIRVNNETVKPHEVQLIPDFYQTFDFTVNGKRVHGFAGATKDPATNWKFGFDLISYGRIIKSHDLLSRQAHTSLARLVGEIHLDDFKTDIHKTDFIRSNDDWSIMEDRLLNVELRELLGRISKLTNREVFRKYEKEMYKVSTTLNKVIANSDFLNNLDIEEGVLKNLRDRIERKKRSQDGKKEKSKETAIEKEKEMKDEKKERKARRNAYPLMISEPIGMSLGEEQPSRRWIVYEEDGQSVINVEVNLDHPSYKDEDEIPIAMRTAVVDSVAEFLLQEEKKHGLLEDEIERLNRIKDMIIRYSTSV